METSSQAAAGGAATRPLADNIEEHLCAGSCGLPIPAIRLRHVPTAAMCVACTEAAGDVPLRRRFDDRVDDDSVAEIYYTGTNHYIDGLIARRCQARYENSEDDTVTARRRPPLKAVNAEKEWATEAGPVEPLIPALRVDTKAA